MSEPSTAPVGDHEPAQETTGPDGIVRDKSGTKVGINQPGVPKGETSYVLLRYVGGSASTGWEMLGVYPARDPDAAIKEYVETADKEDAAGPFVAIASKFWRPVTPAVEVVTTKTITLKAAS